MSAAIGAAARQRKVSVASSGARFLRTGVARGFTLIELVISIAIVAIAVTAVVGALSANAAQSADRMIQQQATAIASSYLDEILQKPYDDPDGVNGEIARTAFDNVADYNGLSNAGARDQTDSPIPGLGGYNVTVSVGAGSLGGVPVGAVRLVVVTVRHPNTGKTVVMSGYRTRH
jgi:MSHA pilin protein MshD